MLVSLIVFVCVCVCVVYVWLFASIVALQFDRSHSICVLATVQRACGSLAQDKGGPNKGGFLNNRRRSYTDQYLYNDIN